jgi:predicted HTH domain antitoxin
MAYISKLSDASKYIGMTLTEFETTFDDRDAILYALGIGFN